MQSTRFKDLRSKAKPEYKINVRRNLAVIEQIYAVLDQKSWTQKQLSDAMGKTESEISKWMTGTHNFTLLTISKIEAALGEEILITPTQARDRWVSIQAPLAVMASPNAFVACEPSFLQAKEGSKYLEGYAYVTKPSDFQSKWEPIEQYFQDQIDKHSIDAKEESHVTAA